MRRDFENECGLSSRCTWAVILIITSWYSKAYDKRLSRGLRKKKAGLGVTRKFRNRKILFCSPLPAHLLATVCVLLSFFNYVCFVSVASNILRKHSLTAKSLVFWLLRIFLPLFYNWDWALQFDILISCDFL